MSDRRHLAMLQRARLRVTPQRLAVLRALATGAHLATCQDIWRRAHRSAVGLGLVTVYRILERLRAAGLVEFVEVRGAGQYGLADRHHDHTICQRCGAVEPTAACLVEVAPDSRLRPSGFLVKGHRLDLLGLCKACQEATAAR